jgi:hypothetical protein
MEAVMRQLKRWRYYCDFCKKVGGHKWRMEIHEKHCTANPNRECRVCTHLLGEIQQPLPDLIAAYSRSWKEMRDLCCNCPACTLAVMRQAPDDACPESRVYPSGFAKPAADSYHGFVFKDHMTALMSEFREEHDHHPPAYYG